MGAYRWEHIGYCTAIILEIVCVFYNIIQGVIVMLNVVLEEVV